MINHGIYLGMGYRHCTQEDWEKIVPTDKNEECLKPSHQAALDMHQKLPFGDDSSS